MNKRIYLLLEVKKRELDRFDKKFTHEKHKEVGGFNEIHIYHILSSRIIN